MKNPMDMVIDSFKSASEKAWLNCLKEFELGDVTEREKAIFKSMFEAGFAITEREKVIFKSMLEAGFAITEREKVIFKSMFEAGFASAILWITEHADTGGRARSDAGP